MSETTEVISQLAEKLVELGGSRIPPPMVFAGSKSSVSITAFFFAFERYCLAQYKKDEVSWLQVLPSFLEGEARSIVQAFGYGVEYSVVKQRLTEEFTRRHTLGSNAVSDFFSATRRDQESLTCYSIRLQTLAGRVSSVEDGSRDEMVKSKLCSALPEGIMQQVNTQLGHLSDVSLEQVIRLAVLLENQLTKTVNRAGAAGVETPRAADPAGRTGMNGRVPVCKGCGRTGHEEAACRRGRNVCYACGEPGHFSRECPKNRRRNAPVTGCDFCGKGPHSLAACEMFVQRCLSCSWCGEVDHASYECRRKPKSGN